MIIPVKSDSLSYDIVLERGALSCAEKYIDLDRKVLVVTDSGVPSEYSAAISSKAKSSAVIVLEKGEATKNFESFKKILSAMLENSFTRKDCVVAVGGGMVGDLAGFAASCYMRGVDFYNVPTTLLSQLDSSIGGKTAIDFESVKNIVGAFYPPKGVIIDPDVLKTLGKRELHAGLAEGIKMAATGDKELFEFIEKSENLDADLERIIEGGLMFKKKVVEEDPREKGIRKVLNFGHTIGHAIESVHEGSLLHGECVAAGMIPMSGPGLRERLIKLLKKYDLPCEIEESPEELMPYMKHDKKMQGESINIIYCEEPGRFEIRNINPAEIADYLENSK